MYLLVGLGNPGDKYRATRHNVGFLFLDYFAQKHAVAFSGSKWQADVAKVRLWGESIVLAKPLTYMNLSGTAVAKIIAYHRIRLERIIVVHDEIDLPLGRVKMVAGRGAGGHNGVRSIMEHAGGREFVRLRVGIGRPKTQQDSASYVLSKLPSPEMDILEREFPLLEEGVRLFVEKGITAAMNQINSIRAENGS